MRLNADCIVIAETLCSENFIVASKEHGSQSALTNSFLVMIRVLPIELLINIPITNAFM